MDLGKVGVWTSFRPFGVERVGEAARLVEQLGYGTLWVGGSPRVADVRPVLEATSTLVAATGILNVWINDPAETAAQDTVLRADFPGRFMLGIGIGHAEATSDYRRPLASMRTFPYGLDGSPVPPPLGERCLAALGPKCSISPESGRQVRTRTSCPSSTPGSHARGSDPASSSRPS